MRDREDGIERKHRKLREPDALRSAVGVVLRRDLEELARTTLATQGVPLDNVSLVRSVRMRYSMQIHDVEVADDLLVVADDIDLPLGKLRLRRSGSAGGHNGLRDILAAFGTAEFARLRVGIGRAGETVDHVLSTFKPGERELTAEMIAIAADAAERWLGEGIEAAMNAFNGVEITG